MEKIFRFIVKVFTHNKCDFCGLTKDETFVNIETYAGIEYCKKCENKYKINEKH